jgi:hypothetical protein
MERTTSFDVEEQRHTMESHARETPEHFVTLKPICGAVSRPTVSDALVDPFRVAGSHLRFFKNWVPSYRMAELRYRQKVPVSFGRSRSRDKAVDSVEPCLAQE